MIRFLEVPPAVCYRLAAVDIGGVAAAKRGGLDCSWAAPRPGYSYTIPLLSLLLYCRLCFYLPLLPPACTVSSQSASISAFPL